MQGNQRAHHKITFNKTQGKQIALVVLRGLSLRPSAMQQPFEHRNQVGLGGVVSSEPAIATASLCLEELLQKQGVHVDIWGLGDGELRASCKLGV